MNSLQNQPVLESLIESCNVNHLLLLGVQIWNQLLDSIDLSLLPHEWKIIVQVVRVIGVRHINLQEVTLPAFLDVALKLTWVLHPFEPANGEVLTHRQTIHVLAVCLCILMTVLVMHFEYFT